MKSARQTAFEILNKINRDNSYSNLTLDSVLTGSDLSEPDASFTSALVYGVLERRITLDYVLSRHLKQPIKKLKPQVLTALRMGAVQLLFMDKIPTSAAVNESVTLVRNNGCAFAAGLTNAVLRAIGREGLILPDDKDFDLYCSVRYSFPLWLVRLWRDSYGDENAKGIMAACAGRPPLTVRVNTLRTTVEQLKETLREKGVEAEDAACQNALNLGKCGSVERLKSFHQGLFHVQDAASQLCAAALDPQPGDTVLDLCSAPGGKAFTAAQLMNDSGRIICCDIHSHRLALIKEGAMRLGLRSIDVALNDAAVPNDRLPTADRVLCDVPCSGLGIVRRKPEIRFKDQAEVDNLPQLQYNILNCSANYVKKGGRLVYSTCALNPAENEAVTRRFLREHPAFSAVEPSVGGKNSFVRDHTLTLMPHKDQTDGFFIAVFERG